MGGDGSWELGGGGLIVAGGWRMATAWGAWWGQRAEIGGEVLFGGADHLGRGAAEADGNGAGGHDEFARGVRAEDSDDGLAGAFGGLGVFEGVGNHAVKAGERIAGAGVYVVVVSACAR